MTDGSRLPLPDTLPPKRNGSEGDLPPDGSSVIAEFGEALRRKCKSMLERIISALIRQYAKELFFAIVPQRTRHVADWLLPVWAPRLLVDHLPHGLRFPMPGQRTTHEIFRHRPMRKQVCLTHGIGDEQAESLEFLNQKIRAFRL